MMMFDVYTFSLSAQLATSVPVLSSMLVEPMVLRLYMLTLESVPCTRTMRAWQFSPAANVEQSVR